MPRYKLTQARSFTPPVAKLPDDVRKMLADVYRVLAQGPLPGDSLLQVEPLPGASDTYTVPFGGAGQHPPWPRSPHLRQCPASVA